MGVESKTLRRLNIRGLNDRSMISLANTPASSSPFRERMSTVSGHETPQTLEKNKKRVIKSLRRRINSFSVPKKGEANVSEKCWKVW